MLVEAGIEDANLDRYSLSNPDALHKQALAAAVADARVKAEAIAAGSGVRIVKLRRVQYGAERAPLVASTDEIVVVTANARRRPKIDLELDPQPIEIRTEVIAEFEIQ
jgi:hypothetical protein